MKTRFLLAGLAAIVMLPGLTIGDANADHRRHWFFDSYTQYEDDAYTSYIPRSRLRKRRTGTLNRDPLRLYEEGYISEREYRKIMRAERRKESQYRVKPRKAEKYKRWRNRQIRYDLAPGAKPRKRKQLANVPLPRIRPFDEEFIITGNIKRSTETAAFDRDPVAIEPIEPVTAPTRTEAAKPKQLRKVVTNKKVKGRISCRSAEKIVAGFGFTDIEARSCNGKSYDFAAQRDGKPFTITLSSASGELTEVKRN